MGAVAVAGMWATLFSGLRRADELTAEALRPMAAPPAAGSNP
jgi:hypothetical protein